MSTANSYGDTPMPANVSSALRSRSTASCERRSGKPARSWRWPILAVVLGLFAHQEALAQTDGSALATLTLDGVTVPGFDPTVQTSNFTAADVLFGTTQVTVDATEKANWNVEILGDDADTVETGQQRNLRQGSNTITVRATSTANPPESPSPRNYTIRVTREAPEEGSALESLALYEGDAQTTAITLAPPGFLNTRDDRLFTAAVNRSVEAVTVAAEAKLGWDDLTYPFQGNTDYPDAHSNAGYQRSLVVGANPITVRATPIGASGPRDYTITVTRTTWPSAPGNLRATPANRTVGLSWTTPSSNGGRFISQYQYRMKDEDQDDYSSWVGIGSPSTGPGDNATTSHSVLTIGTGSDLLVNGTTYLFQVRAVNVNVILDDDGIASNTAEATPARPLPRPEWTLTTDTATPDPVVVGHRRVTLSWTRIPDATVTTMDDESVTGYDYRRRVEGGSPGGWTTIADRDLVESGTTRSYTVTPLTNGTRYGFQVRGRNSVGGGAESTEVYGTPEAKAPGAPTNLRATAGDEQVTLEWTAPADGGGEPITRYDYKFDDEPLPANDPANWITTGGTQTTVAVHGLANRTTYYFRVRAVNDLGCTDAETDGCGLASLEVSATPLGKPVTRVNLTTATSDEDRQVKLEWSLLGTPPPPADDRSGFEYRQRAGGGYGNWIDVRNSDAGTTEHTVSSLMNGTTYTFQVRAANSSGGGLASNEESAVPSTTPGAPRLTATPGDDQVRLTWTPAASGGRRIIRYECRLRIGAGVYSSDTSTPSGCAGKSLGASATSLTLTDDDVVDASTTPDTTIRNGTTYTFQVRAVNDREGRVDPAGDGTQTLDADDARGGWSNEASARPRDGSERSYTISATIDGKSWAKAGDDSPLRVTVEVNPRFTAQSTRLWVDVDGSGLANPPELVDFGPTNSRRDASFTVNPTFNPLSPYFTVALLSASDSDPSTPNSDPTTALAVTSVEVRHADTPAPPTGLVATRGNGEVTLSWATVTGATEHHYRQRRQPGSYGRWTDFAGDEFRRSGTVTSNTVTGLTDGGTYAFQVRALLGGWSDPSDEVSVSLSGTVETGGLSAPRNLDAAAGDGRVTLSWTAPAADGGAAISGYQYQRRAGAGAYGQWTTIPGGPSVRSFIVTGLTNGTRYFFRVRAVNSDGEGPGSTEESATPSLGVDTTLRTLSLSTVALAPVTLTPAFTPATRTYTATVTGSVTQVTVAATVNKTGLPPPTITPADASTAVAGHQVALAVGLNTIRVTVADGTNSDVYTIRVTRAARVPAAPTGLTAATAEDGGGAVTLSWTAPTGGGAVSRYEYQQKAGTDAYGAWTPIPGSGPSTTSHTVTGLTNGTAYAFRVRAVNSVGNGAASNEATATPALVRLVWAKTEQEVADAITAARNAGYGDDMTFTAGETVVVRGSALFNAAEGVSLTFRTTSDDTDAATAAASDGTVTVTARAAGMATITITAQASQPSGVTIVDQTDPGEASITFPVEVGLEALTLELSGPEDGTNLVEGGRAHANGTAGTVTVRATANRPVTEEVTVTLLPDRAMSDATATADDFAADPIVIEAGETTGLTVVIAVEDETAEGMEELVLFGVAAGNAGAVTGEVRLRLWDAAVPALPLVAQLLLAAFLAIGGYRRYRRR